MVQNLAVVFSSPAPSVGVAGAPKQKPLAAGITNDGEAWEPKVLLVGFTALTDAPKLKPEGQG